MSTPCIESSNSWPTVGAALVCIAIGLGAWAAHGLERTIGPQYEGITKSVAGQIVPGVTKYVGDFRTAADSQLGQGLGLILVGILIRQGSNRALRAAAWCLFAGTLIFSGSLYILVLTGMTWLGAITPIGGLLLMIGWAIVAYGVCPCRK